MKIIHALFFLLLLSSCAGAKEINYTASTPAAAPVIRTFLNIPMTDSVDFIRWKLTLDGKQYILHCNYGIGKPNTNGFMYDGKTIAIKGVWEKEKNILQLHHNNHILKLIELNANLLHLLDAGNNLLVGNGGWSYTLNNMTASLTDKINSISQSTAIKDSIVFDGRTPCAVPGIIADGKLCYKIKWRIILYANAIKNDTGSYQILGTPWRDRSGRKGNWITRTGNNGQTIYQLNDEKGNGFIYLLQADENILLFTDAKGNLLVGNEDFSYTLNRKY